MLIANKALVHMYCIYYIYYISIMFTNFLSHFYLIMKDKINRKQFFSRRQYNLRRKKEKEHQQKEMQGYKELEKV